MVDTTSSSIVEFVLKKAVLYVWYHTIHRTIIEAHNIINSHNKKFLSLFIHFF